MYFDSHMLFSTNDEGRYQGVATGSCTFTALVCHVGRQIVEETISVDDQDFICEIREQVVESRSSLSCTLSVRSPHDHTGNAAQNY